MNWMDELEDLQEAHEFLDFFKIPYEPRRLEAIRLPLLARFRQNLQDTTIDKVQPEGLYGVYRKALDQAWNDLGQPGARPAFSGGSNCSGCQSQNCRSKSDQGLPSGFELELNLPFERAKALANHDVFDNTNPCPSERP